MQVDNMERVQLETPVAFIIFNRPEETGRTLAAIRLARPTRLFVIADGPRNEMDEPLCEAARAIIENGIDWPCNVNKNYSEVNLGCGRRPATGIDWVFQQVDRAIIIEDDCIPDQTFFQFAEELLKKYESDERVMHIAASSFQEHNPRFSVRESYYFSYLPNVFGCWATWRRAWKLYDYDIKAWPQLKESATLAKEFHNSAAYERFSNVWDDYFTKRITDSWDGQWHFACMSRGALCITPSVNLVRNIGFNERGTHTKEEDQRSVLRMDTMHFPLVDPTILAINRAADNYTFRFYFGIDKKIHHRIVRPLKNISPHVYKKIRDFLKA